MFVAATENSNKELVLTPCAFLPDGLAFWVPRQKIVRLEGKFAGVEYGFLGQIRKKKKTVVFKSSRTGIRVEIMTPKTHICLNTLHQTLRDEFTSCWGRVEEFLVSGEQEIAHTKPFFFPVASAATCTDCHLEVDQSVDTPIDGVDTGYHSLKEIHEDRVQCVDTASECVDTRSSLQKTQLPDWDSVST
ncbi:hypothetical protein Taro_018294 [Colocasia esculenta]|uniref:Uncharacterized protein n=1 Tax=Colocasia esculenta TaxID=4460 RepID=A0A843UQM3_COLES|nr:hypothetical protein [Colocasia esculenta]